MNLDSPFWFHRPSVASIVMREWAQVQLDLDLVKKILVEIEGFDLRRQYTVRLPDQDPLVVARHVELLLQAHLIDGVIVKDLSKPIQEVAVKDMTLEGHQFLAGLKSKTVWGQIKEKLSKEEIARMSLEQITTLVSDLGFSHAREALGLG